MPHSAQLQCTVQELPQLPQLSPLNLSPHTELPLPVPASPWLEAQQPGTPAQRQLMLTGPPPPEAQALAKEAMQLSTQASNLKASRPGCPACTADVYKATSFRGKGAG